MKSLYREVPVKRLIVVDDSSKDGTLKVLKRFPRVEIHQLHGNRAVARQYGIERVETDWFIDDGVILRRNWFKIASKYMEIPKSGQYGGGIKSLIPIQGTE